MIVDPNGSTTKSKPFNTLEWLPTPTIVGYAATYPYPLGEATRYPIRLPARQSSELYWLPKSLAITKARITTEAFDYSFSTPIFPDGPRPNTANPIPGAIIGDMAHKLLFGTGAGVVKRIPNVNVNGSTYAFEVSFLLNPSSILDKIETGSAVWWNIEAFITALPNSTNKKATAHTYIDSNDIVNVGTVKLMWINNVTTGERQTINMYRTTPNPFIDFDRCQVEFELDYVPWEFDD